MDGEGVAILMRRGEPASLVFALDLAITALVGGERVLVGLFQGGLGAWAEAASGGEPAVGDDPWDARVLAARGATPGQRIREGIAACRTLGGDRFEVLACGGDVERLGLDADALIADYVVDDVVGLPTLWRRARSLAVVGL
ncbi:MAG: hypothetical protein EP329_23810 [Deltaproteobacteria bacterium]|nr:MAG: hypothetical protein EP329_23810 [Deltaproteobacteria bacterium]